MKKIISIGEINCRKLDLNFKDSIIVFSVSVFLMTPESQVREKLADEILKICKEYEGEISCPIVFDGSLLMRCRFDYREAAESFIRTLILEYENKYI